MGKTYHRKTHISVRREHEEEEKRKNRKRLTKKQKVWMWSSIGAVVLAIVLFVAFYAPNGSVITWFGTPMFTASDAMIAKVGGRYYDVGSWKAPEGFTQDSSYSIKSDKNQFEAYYTNDNADSPLASVYVSVVPEQTVEAMREKYLAYNADVSEVATLKGENFEYQYFSSVTAVDSSDTASLYYRNVAGYVQTSRDCLILINGNSTKAAQDKVPSLEEMISELEPLLNCLTLK